jgi:hypothetical protein
VRLAIGDFLGWGLLRALFGDHHRGPLHARARVLAGAHVLYREFDGEHSISLEIALEAIGWFTQQKSPKGPVSAVPGADLLALRPQLRVALVK